MSFRCDADNIVMQNELERPLSNFLYLTVMCKCFNRVLMIFSSGFFFAFELSVCFCFVGTFDTEPHVNVDIKFGYFFVFGRSTGGYRIADKLVSDRKW